MSRSEAVIEVTRGGRIESRHRVSAAAVDSQGRLRAWLGDPELVTFLRSAAKPLQALPLVADGAADAYELTEAELAVCCASHSGEPRHIATVKGILARIGCNESDLACGPHAPFYPPAAEALRTEGREGREPGRLHNNCSGKHAGMLAWSRHAGVDVTGYHQAHHPVQMRICREIADRAGSRCEELISGVDGCGVPSFALPLNVVATVFADMVARAENDPSSPEARVLGAMTSEPYYVAGTDRLTTRLMQTTGGRLMAKFGAEAVYCLADRRRRWGIALKVEDGNARAIGPAVIEFLDQLGLLSSGELEALADRQVVTVTNTRDEDVGVIRPEFRVESTD
ncbi:MAG: asparaginase [Gemmatimonadetes bacterium]|uniref:Asparaginase n=1 Tax=Candidatus Kutchimonas denitrificans TaxID=3056748 RepID=A0AAE4Z745_9BACT|nr:asparaginase [Gemmatimonadota bacterium]NIR73947.1 asparaginase [Candidatus Kutchimonas denitrificans]NIR99753.1 asparaginase [Gemmatimonadota bacterium]NIT65338.1 asparaginase [Gemmatimonadota bacterium]NIW73787.1 asparaginase [Gemmatimonadota bacterium]